MEIIQLESSSGKYRVLVLLPDGNAVPLKYQETIPDEQVFADVQIILDRQAEEKAEREYLAQLIEEERLLNGNT